VTPSSTSKAADAFRSGRDARVVATSPSSAKDVTVLHIEGEQDPVLLVRPSPTPAGTPIAVIGFPPARTFSVPPTFTYGTVVASGRGTTGLGLPTDPSAAGLAADATVIRVDAYAEHGDSGGPAVDESGRIAGLVSFGADPNGPLRAAFLISAADITQVLGQAGVTNRLGPGDGAWRAGLAAYDRGDLRAALDDFRSCAAASTLNIGCRDWIAIAGAPPGGRDVRTLLLAGGVAALAAGGLAGAARAWQLRRRRARARRALFRA